MLRIALMLALIELCLTSVSCQRSRMLTVRDLGGVARAHSQVVAVRGCYRNFRETSLMMPCEDPKPNEVFRVLFRSELENIRRYVPGFVSGQHSYERPSLSEKELERKLSTLPDGVLAEIVVRGELSSSTGQTNAEFEPEFIVYRVLRFARK